MAKKKTKKKTTQKPVVAETHHPKVKREAITSEQWNIVILAVGAILIIGILAGVANLLQSIESPIAGGNPSIFAGGTQGAVMQKEVLKAEVEEFVQTYMLTPGMEVVISDVVEESGMYKMKLTLIVGDEQEVIDSYATMDGKVFFPRGIVMQEIEDTDREAASVFDAPDAEKPEVKFFVMSFCPYGLQAEQGLEPVFRVLGDSVEWSPHYVIYENYAGGGPDFCLDDGNLCSMHGIDELMENARQLCIKKNYDKTILWDYLKYVYTSCSLSTINDCWKDAAAANGIDTALVETCVDNEAVELLTAEKDLNMEYGVQGSPSVFINDASYSGGRAPENYKQAICSGFVTMPEACNVELGAAAESASGSC